MSQHDEVRITKTTYNLVAILGWIGVALGLLAGGVQIWQPTKGVIEFLVVGLIASGVTVSFAGPVQKKTQHKVLLRRAPPQPESK